MCIQVRGVCALVSTSQDPGRIDRLIADQFLWFKPQSHFGGRVFGTVASVNKVILHTQSEVAADGARRRLGAIRRTDEVARDGHRLRSLQYKRYCWARCNELQQW